MQPGSGLGAPTGGCQSKTLSRLPDEPEVTVSTPKLGGASTRGASSSVPSLNVDGNQGPERGKHLLKATQHGTDSVKPEQDLLALDRRREGQMARQLDG